MEWEGVYWISLAQVGDSSWAAVNTVMNVKFTSDAGRYLTGSATMSFSKGTLLRDDRNLTFQDGAI
jgi:hypothetical protein